MNETDERPEGRAVMREVQTEYDAAAIGELLVDFVAGGTNGAGYPILSAFPGGAPANYLAALAKFGMKAGMVGKVGDDAFARLLIGSLKGLGIGTEGIVCDGRFFTTLAFVTLDRAGDREFSFARKPGADMCLEKEEADLSLIDRAGSLYFGGTSLTAEPMRSTVRRVVTRARDQGKLIVFDPNLRKPLWDDLNRAREEMLWGMAQADVVKVSEEEAAFLFGEGIEEAALAMREQCGVSLAFLTLGERGCYFSSRNAGGYVGGLKGIRVVDTTGAGDIFTGSAVYQILRSGKKPWELCEQELRGIAEFACASAGLSAARPGGMTSVSSMAEIRWAAEKLQETD